MNGPAPKMLVAVALLAACAPRPAAPRGHGARAGSAVSERAPSPRLLRGIRLTAQPPASSRSTIPSPRVAVADPFDLDQVPVRGSGPARIAVSRFDRSERVRWFGMAEAVRFPSAHCPPAVAGMSEVVFEELTGVDSAGLTVDRWEGSMQLSRCTGRVRRTETVRAQPLVPRALYVYRAVEQGETRLVVVAPPSVFVASSNAPEEQLDKWSQAFTRVPLLIAEGTASSVRIHVRGSDVDGFGGLFGFARGASEQRGFVADRLYAFGVDVVWQRGKKPLSTMFVSEVATPAAPGIDGSILEP